MRSLARWVLSCGISVGLAGCSQAPSQLSRWSAEVDATVRRASDARDLLAAARHSLHDGVLGSEARARLLASADPQHARAQRVLRAMDTAATSVPPPTPPEPDAGLQAPRIKLATPPPESAEAASPRRAGPPSRSATPTASGSSSASKAPAPGPRATLRGVGLSSTKRGAALSLQGSGGLVVGVANQPRSGIVRLVMDADASTSALSSRPKVTGARVTGVRRTGKTVFVTLSLDPGWSLRGITRTRKGARVDLRRPA